MRQRHSPGSKPQPAGEPAFARLAAERGRFGRDRSPHFGNLAPLASDERGAAMIEYALICALIALAAFSAIGHLANSVVGQWNSIDSQVANATAGPST